MQYRLKKGILSMLFLNMTIILNAADPQEEFDDCLPKEETRNFINNTDCIQCCSTKFYPCGITTFIPRSQGANTARELVGWQKQIFRPFLCQNYATTAFTFEYSRSFESCKIAQRLFCTDCLTFAGSQVESRVNGKDIVADYFGLATDFKGTLFIKPRIENYILDFNFFFGLDNWSSGAFLRIHAPLVHTSWNLGLDDCIVCDNKNKGNTTFPDCYMSSETIQTTTPDNCASNERKITITQNCQRKTICAPIRQTAASLREALSGNFIFGDMDEPWEFGRFNFCSSNKTGFADIDIIYGYNICQSDYGHFAFFGQVVIPTGNRPRALVIFEPILGNGKHWELGGGISTHISVRNDYYDQGFNAGIYIEGNATYMFKSSQKRALDFTKNGLFSRYILLKEFDSNNNYIGKLINAINFATRNVDVIIGYKVDASVKFYIQRCGWQFDLGYNVYSREKEKVCLKTDCPCDIDERKFGIKGTEGVCCNEHEVELDMNIIDPQATKKLLNTTQPDATMFTVPPAPVAQSIMPDDLFPCSTDENETCVCLSYLNPPIVNESIVGQKFIFANTTAKPVLVTCKDLDLNSAAQSRLLTHKIFWHIGYKWIHCYEPHFGIGGEVEFDDSKCNAGLSQWGVWFKASITF